jgi:hypothetical protein
MFGFTKLALACAAGLAVFFVFSNIGYYVGSGYFSLGIAEYARRVAVYFPHYLEITLLYSAAGVAIAAAAFYLRREHRIAAR